MYDEAISTFEYIVRQDRPVKEMLYADYTFLNKPLAKFYGIEKDVESTGKVEKVDGAQAFDRGGALRLGAVLTTTSAPLRTSPVKRGDWVLRRILGTPTPPPPADAGTIPADDQDVQRPDAARAAGPAQAQRDLRQLSPAHRSARLPARGLRRGRPPPADLCRRQGRRRHRRVRRQDHDRRRRRPAELPPEPGQEGDDDAVEEDDRVRAGADGAGVRSTADRRDDGGRRRRVVLGPRGQDCHQPPVPQPGGRHGVAPARRRHRRPPEQEPSDEPSTTSSRRPRGVTSCEASASRWRCPGWSRCRSSARPHGRGQGEHAAAAAGHRVLLERRRADSLVGQGQRRDDGARAGGAADDAAPRGHGLHPGPLQPDARTSRPARTSGRMNVLSGAPVSLDPNEIRVGTSMDQIIASQIGDRTAIPSLVLGIEPNELRLEDGLVDDLRVEPVVGLADQARDQGDLPVARVRSARRRRLRPHDRPEHPRRRPAGLAEPAAEDQQRRQRQAERVLRVDPRHREADRARVEGRAHRRLASDARRSPTCRVRRTSCRRTFRIT